MNKPWPREELIYNWYEVTGYLQDKYNIDDFDFILQRQEVGNDSFFRLYIDKENYGTEEEKRAISAIKKEFFPDSEIGIFWISW